MANIENVLGGLEILHRHDRGVGTVGPDRAGGHVSAEHDILYAGCHVGGTPDDLTAEDRERLEQLGWLWDDSLDCWFHFT